MTGIPHLSDIPDEERVKLLNSLGRSRTDITIKIDGTAFVVHFDTDGPKFYGRMGGDRICRAKRLIMDIYEKPIAQVMSRWEQRNTIYPELYSYIGAWAFLELYRGRIFMSCVSWGWHEGMARAEELLGPSHPDVLALAEMLDVEQPPLIHSGPIESDYVQAIIKSAEMGLMDFAEMLEDLAWLISPVHIPYKETPSIEDEGIVLYVDQGKGPTAYKITHRTFRDELAAKRKVSRSPAATEYRALLNHYFFGQGAFQFKHLVPRDMLIHDSFEDTFCNLVKRFQDKEQLFYSQTEAYRKGIDETRVEELRPNLTTQRNRDIIAAKWQNVDVLRFLVMALGREDFRPIRNSDCETVEVAKEASRLILEERRPRPPVPAAPLLPDKTQKLLDALPESQDKKRTLIIGRFQPPHLGHYQMARLAKHPIIYAIVQGKRENDRNFLDAKDVMQGLYGITPDGTASIHVAEHGHAGILCSMLRQKGYEIAEIICGEDRLDDYSRTIAPVNRVPHPNSYDIDIVLAQRIASGTQVREALRSGNFLAFVDLMPPNSERLFVPYREELLAKLARDK